MSAVGRTDYISDAETEECPSQLTGHLDTPTLNHEAK
jgi:hypothetical protein